MMNRTTLDRFPSLTEGEIGEMMRLVTPIYSYYQREYPNGPTWFGSGGSQWAIDLMMYQECFHATKPRTIIETGTASGWAASFYAEILRRTHQDENFRVVTIELTKEQVQDFVKAPNIVSLIGSSVDPRIVEEVRKNLIGPVAVMLDSAHDADHVLSEMRTYAPLVSPGQYMIVQDTWLGLAEGYGMTWQTQPLGAVERFMQENNDFVIDLHPHRWLITQHPLGWLRKKA